MGEGAGAGAGTGEGVGIGVSTGATWARGAWAHQQIKQRII